jgi:hypothetical protein
MPFGSKIFKGVLGKFTGDTPTKITGALPDEAPKVSRRGVLTGMAAAPVAGALGELPISKIVSDVAPVAKVAKKLIPKGFRITNLPSLKKMYDDYTDTVFRENSDMYDSEDMKEIILGEFEVEELKDMGIDPNNITRSDYLDDRIAERLAPNDPQVTYDDYNFAVSSLADSIDDEAFKGSLVEKIIDEIREIYPDATDQQIFDELGELYEGASESFSDFIPQSKLKYKAIE